MPFFTASDGCKIFYSTYGMDSAKPTVVFLNGTTQTTLYWGNQVPGLSRRYNLLFYDARGQGQSDLGRDPISLNLHVVDLKNLLAHISVANVHLVGLSHGARLALEFALASPKIVDRLVLCSTSAQTSHRCRTIVRSWLEILKHSDLKAMAWAALPIVFGSTFLKDHQNILDKIVEAVVIRNRRKSLIAQLDALLRYPPLSDLTTAYDKPTLIITGSEDPLVEPDDVRQLAHACRAGHRQLAGIGHSVPAEAPEIFQKLVLEFFK